MKKSDLVGRLSFGGVLSSSYRSTHSLATAKVFLSCPDLDCDLLVNIHTFNRSCIYLYLNGRHSSNELQLSLGGSLQAFCENSELSNICQMKSRVSFPLASLARSSYLSLLLER